MSPTGVASDVDAVSVARAAVTDSVADCLAGEPGDEVRVRRVSDEPRVGAVPDRPAPTDVLGFVPEGLRLGELPVESETTSLVDEERVDPDVPVDSDVLVDPDELADPDEELDCPPSSANADPIPPVPTNPATPSEKATAPTRNATFAEFTSGRTPPSERGSDRSSAAQPDVPEAVTTLAAIPMSVVGVALRDLDVRAIHLAGFERRVAALHLHFVGVRHADTKGE
ncbi:hypothetical protein AU193_16555 [Mycobacterium sp. GA-1285]|uniref:hypothetical protein n=1 Tax=Mycobacterium sp. GA-1285 TaxID=1772282 RepID=UPI00074A95A9|nr:hypothetical protein [Mycobacterium sp. GA-1285]KUI20169.1 hypothetical protein AU193_16555 [Mycobacterium sp. GA-1285]